MHYPLALRSRRIVFLVALLCPSVTLAYIAIPHDHDLRRVTASARTQDIVIDNNAGSRAAMAFLMAPSGAIDRTAGAHTAADNAAITELALATSALNAFTFGAPSAQNDGAGAFVDNSGPSVHELRHGSTGTGFANHGLAAAGAWGGASGSTAHDSTGTHEASTHTVTTKAAAAPKAPVQHQPKAPATPHSHATAGGSSTGAGSAQPQLVASAALAAAPILSPTGAPVFTTGGGTVGSVPHVGVLGGGAGSPSPTPEPMSLLLMGTGVAGVFLARRRRG